MNEQKPKILVVEDNLESAYDAVSALNSLGDNEVLIAHDLGTALRLIEEKRPQHILTDVCFYESGVSTEQQYVDETLARIKNDAQYPTEKRAFDLVSEAYSAALKRSISRDTAIGRAYSGTTSKEIKDTLLDHANGRLEDFFYVTEGQLGIASLEDARKRMQDLCHSNSMAPLGYFIAKEAQDRGIPFGVYSDFSHGYGVVPLLLELGVGNKEEFKSMVRGFRDETSDKKLRIVTNKSKTSHGWLSVFNGTKKA